MSMQNINTAQTKYFISHNIKVMYQCSHTSKKIKSNAKTHLNPEMLLKPDYSVKLICQKS